MLTHAHDPHDTLCSIHYYIFIKGHLRFKKTIDLRFEVLLLKVLMFFFESEYNADNKPESSVKSPYVFLNQNTTPTTNQNHQPNQNKMITSAVHQRLQQHLTKPVTKPTRKKRAVPAILGERKQ